MARLEKIPSKDLPDLRGLYKINWPLHAVTYSMIKLFIDRFKDQPEWEEKATFWSFIGEWAKEGTFIMVNGLHVFINTLELAPYNSLKKSLDALEFDRDFIFICVRDVFRQTVFDAIRQKNFIIAFDTGMKCFYREKEYFLDLDFQTPDGTVMGPLTIENAAKVNSLWPGRYPGSEKFIVSLIENNPSMGVFSETDGDLMAWQHRLDIGSTGIGQVDLKYKSQGYGGTAFVGLCAVLAKFFDCDMTTHIVHGNYLSEDRFIQAGLELIDCNSWIGVKKNNMLNHWPLWGHL